MIYIYSVKGIWKFEIDSNIQTVINLKKAYVQKYPEFNLGNIHIYDDSRILLYDSDLLQNNIRYHLVIRPITCLHP